MLYFCSSFYQQIELLLIKNALTVDVIGQSARIGCVTRSTKLHPKTRVVRQHFTGFVFIALLIFPKYFVQLFNEQVKDLIKNKRMSLTGVIFI